MRSLRESIGRSWMPGLLDLGAGLAPALDLPSPLSISALMRVFDQVETRRFTAAIDTDAMHGDTELIVHSDGRYGFSGTVRATGIPSFSYKVMATLRTPGGALLAVEAGGEVFGKDTPKHSTSHWDEGGSSSEIVRFWTDLRRASTVFETDTQKKVIGTIGTVIDVAETVVELYVAAQFRGLIGVVIVLGVRLGSESGTTFVNPNLLAGITVAGGVLVLFGPGAIVPALVAGTGTALLADIHHRPMSDPEKALARQVFGDQLPFDRIVLTDLYNPSTTPNGTALDREFTFPAIDGGIWVNLGKNFVDPLGVDVNKRGSYKTRGQVLIHELVHAWQIAHVDLVSLGCDALVDSNYTYGVERVAAGVPFHQFGHEEQAAIIDSWYGQFVTKGLTKTEALRDPRFRYVEHNIRVGHDH